MKHNRKILWRTGRCFPKRIWIFAMIMSCLWFYSGRMTAEAEPASLVSEGAVIYEQMNEGSNAVGNLVRGSNFELLGSVTAEDGSAWYHVSAFGIQGYIKGNAEIGEGVAEPEPEETAVTETENNGPEAADGAENVGAEITGGTEAENPGPDIAAATEAENPEQGDAAEEETGDDISEETEEEASGEPPAVYQGNNTREKTYAVGSGSLKSAGSENQAEGSESAQRGKSDEKAVKRINKAFVFLVVVTIGSILTALVSFGKIKEEIKRDRGTEEGQEGSSKSVKNRKAIHKKKRHRKKKGKAKKNGNTKK